MNILANITSKVTSLILHLVTLMVSRPARMLCGVLLFVGLSGVGAQASLTDRLERDASDETVDLVTAAFESADYEALLDLAQRRVEIMILGKGARYSHSQAEMVLRNFFRQHPPERVELTEQSATDDDRAAMGQYWAESGESPLSIHVGFRVSRDDEWQLGSIRIERPSYQRSRNG